MSMPCPCCGSVAPHAQIAPPYVECPACGHRWHTAPRQNPLARYAALGERNDPNAPWFAEKLADRVRVLEGLITMHGANRILEVGCAEGALGRAVKAIADVAYEGVELSRDADAAASSLDRVHRVPCDAIDTGPYDVIASFHVLEHIADGEHELRNWWRLLGNEGRIVVDVPNRAGHPLLEIDRNAEHLHQFCIGSLACLLARCGFDIETLERGHPESPVYPDNLRIVARKAPPVEARAAALVDRFTRLLGGRFLVYGIGGDFDNYLLPVLEHLPVAGLLDSSPAKQGMIVAGRQIEAYAPEQHDRLPVLVCSIRFGENICRHLRTLGIDEARIVRLSEIYGEA